MRRQSEKLVPSNYICECECHTDPEIKHPTPCCFVCPKCKENVAAHIYNAHVHTCSRANALRKHTDIKHTEEQPKPGTRKRLIDLPTMPGSARSRYRKR